MRAFSRATDRFSGNEPGLRRARAVAWATNRSSAGMSQRESRDREASPRPFERRTSRAPRARWWRPMWWQPTSARPGTRHEQQSHATPRTPRTPARAGRFRRTRHHTHWDRRFQSGGSHPTVCDYRRKCSPPAQVRSRTRVSTYEGHGSAFPGGWQRHAAVFGDSAGGLRRCPANPRRGHQHTSAAKLRHSAGTSCNWPQGALMRANDEVRQASCRARSGVTRTQAGRGYTAGKASWHPA